MRQLPIVVFSALVLAIASGGAATLVAQADSTPPAAPAKKAKHDENRITAEEIAASKRPMVYDAVDKLRPNWLRKDMLTGEDVVVYMDEQNLGGSDKLRDMPSVDVAELQYVAHADATRRWGSDIKGSVIVVVRRR